jgi:hypothetical protein
VSLGARTPCSSRHVIDHLAPRQRADCNPKSPSPIFGPSRTSAVWKNECTASFVLATRRSLSVSIALVCAQRILAPIPSQTWGSRATFHCNAIRTTESPVRHPLAGTHQIAVLDVCRPDHDHRSSHIRRHSHRSSERSCRCHARDYLLVVSQGSLCMKPELVIESVTLD